MAMTTIATAERAFSAALDVPEPRRADFATVDEYVDALALRLDAIRTAGAALNHTQELERRQRDRAKLAASGLTVGAQVQQRGGGGGHHAGRTGRVEQLWLEADGRTVKARVRFVGTWNRWGGSKGDSVVTVKAANLVKVEGA